MSDLAKITFLTLLAGEKMLFIGKNAFFICLKNKSLKCFFPKKFYILK